MYWRRGGCLCTFTPIPACINKCIEDDTKPPIAEAQTALGKQKIKYGEKRFPIWRMEFFHPAMWHVAMGSWHWIRQAAAPCNVAHGFMTCHWIRPNVRHIGILLPVSISTLSPQSTCHSASVCEIFIQFGTTHGRKITLCRFSRWRISDILDFMGLIIGSLKSPCTTSYRSSIETIALNCLVFEKIAFLHFGDRQTDKQMDRPIALSRSRCRERRLNKSRGCAILAQLTCVTDRQTDGRTEIGTLLTIAKHTVRSLR